jgi:hypothetical protein
MEDDPTDAQLQQFKDQLKSDDELFRLFILKAYGDFCSQCIEMGCSKAANWDTFTRFNDV